jgi:hypothetical protein
MWQHTAVDKGCRLLQIDLSFRVKVQEWEDATHAFPNALIAILFSLAVHLLQKQFHKHTP